VIKERIEQMCATPGDQEDMYREHYIGRFGEAGSEAAIADALSVPMRAELPHLLGVKSRHVWVIGDTPTCTL